MKTHILNGQWDALNFFRKLSETNKLAISKNFKFCIVSGLNGLEEAVQNAQYADNFICISEISDGYMEINNTPRTRRIITVFLAMKHRAEDMSARAACMDTMRELFRQFMSLLMLEKVKLEQNCIYIDSRISFNEIDRYFFTGGAGAFFQIAYDVFTDLRFNEDDWSTTPFAI